MAHSKPTLVFRVIAGLTLLALSACEKPTQLPGSGVGFNAITLSVKDTLVPVYVAGGVTFTNQPGIKVTVIDQPGRNAWSGEPVIFNIYKYYYKTRTWNLAARIYGGGGGSAPGDTVYYTDSRGIREAIPCKAVFDTLIILGSDNKNEFQVGVAALSNLFGTGSGFSMGFENQRILDPVLRGSGYSRFISINNGDPYTVSNVVTLKARMPVAGLDSLLVIHYSMLNTVNFSQILTIHNALRSATFADTSQIKLWPGSQMRLSDSLIINSLQVPIGRFGGSVVISKSRLQDYFDSVAYLSPRGSDTGWVYVERRDTLPGWMGQKWVYLYHPDWGIPISTSIGIRPWQMEVLLDEAAAGQNIRRNSFSKTKQVCLTQDNVPVEIRTYGDSSFSSNVSVWIATRNLNSFFVEDLGSAFKISRPTLDQVNNALAADFEWPDAILETPPQQIAFKNGLANGILTPDYEKGYRVSPLSILFVTNPAMLSKEIDYGVTYWNEISFPTGMLMNLTMQPGSVLGYQKKDLDRFGIQDSIYCLKTSGFQSVSSAGWFTYQPLDSVAPDNKFTPANVSSYFQRKGYSGITDLTIAPPNLNVGDGRTYYSIFSAYTYRPDIPFRRSYPYRPPPENPPPGPAPESDGIKLYTNPFRSLPIYASSNMNGSKEFVICAYAYGKYFKEPRVNISSFSGAPQYVWDKIPPHFLWDAGINPKSPTYAPMYILDNLTGLATGSDLSLVDNIFDVWLSTKLPAENKDCSLRDVGFGRIASVKLCFNYSNDRLPGTLGMDAVTGIPGYSKNAIKIDLDPEIMKKQSYATYQYNGASSIGYSIGNASFKKIDARLWQGGLWDMWLETEDDLGNKGMAPVVNSQFSYDRSVGKVSLRQIQIQ